MNNHKSQAKIHPKRKTVQVTSWLKPSVREELESVARKEGISVSAANAALVEEALRYRLHIRNATILEPVIEKIIERKMQPLIKLSNNFLVRILFATEQDRGLSYNILGKMPGVTPSMLDEIIDDAKESAKRKIHRITPEIEELISEANKQFDKAGKKTN